MERDQSGAFAASRLDHSLKLALARDLQRQVLSGLDRAAPVRPQALHRASRDHSDLCLSEEERMSPPLALPARACLLLVTALLGPTIGPEIAFGRDASRAERMRGDDDPIVIPRWVASGSFTLDARDISDLDPESTGSLKRQERR